MGNEYNPMSKEFQDECEKLGLTGRQLIAKYKKEGKFLEKNTRKPYERYTDKELLDFLIQFYEKYGRVPVRRDFANNPEYPSYETYRKRFGSWNNALKLVGMDLDTRVIQGHLDTNVERGRYAELKVIKHFIGHPTDLAGENHSSPCDGICPNGKIYDVKSSKLHKYSDNDIFYQFSTNNLYKEEIEIYYLLGFNEDYTKLNYGWRIPGEIVESDEFRISLNRRSHGFTVDSMKKYDITDKIKDILV